MADAVIDTSDWTADDVPKAISWGMNAGAYAQLVAFRHMLKLHFEGNLDLAIMDEQVSDLIEELEPIIPEQMRTQLQEELERG